MAEVCGKTDWQFADMNSQQELNERFRAYVAERYPDWSGGLVLPEATTSPAGFASLLLGNPRGQEWPSLEVRTEDQRLTVCFGLHHAHFAGADHERLIAACFDPVAGVLDERIVSVMLYHAHRPYVSDFCHVEDLSAVEEASRPRRKAGWFSRFLGQGPKPDSGAQTTWRSYGPVHYALGPPPPGPCHLEIRSWLGTHDRRSVL